MAKLIGPLTADTSKVATHCHLLKIYGSLSYGASAGAISVSMGDTAGSGDAIFERVAQDPADPAFALNLSNEFDIDFGPDGIAFGRTGFSLDLTNTVIVWFLIK